MLNLNNFLKSIPFWLSILQNDFKLNTEELKFNNALSQIEDSELLNSNNLDRQKISDKYLFPFTVLMGELWLNYHPTESGKWEVKSGSNHNFIEPYILAVDGKELHFYERIRKEIEVGNPISLNKVLIEIDFFYNYGVEYDWQNPPVSKPQHILQLINTFDEKFIDLVPTLIKNLENDFRIDENSLDFSTSSLVKLENFIANDLAVSNKNYYNYDDEFIHKHIMALTAYLGEVWIRNVAGGWEIEYDVETDKYAPIIRCPNGNPIRFYECIYAELTENNLPNLTTCYELGGRCK